MNHLKDDCIIPVFSKDNEVTISHQSFIDTILDAAQSVFPRESITDPAIRVSHVVKGRIPEAIHKPVSQLLESDKTIYYERMMFCFEVPSIPLLVELADYARIFCSRAVVRVEEYSPANYSVWSLYA